MHRSGTSVVASLLHDLGGDFGDPRDLMEEDQWNAEGYFEDVHVVSLNDALVLGDYERARGFFAGKARQNPRLNVRWALRQSLAKARYFLPVNFLAIRLRARELEDEMENLARDRDERWVKDPRFCLTLHEWLPRIIEKPRVILSYRHPEEVAGSLARRDRCPRMIGRRLWREHNARILRTCSDHGLEPCVISFRNLFDPNQALDEMRLLFHALGRPWDREKAGAALEKRVKGALRHHQARSPEPRSGEASLYALLQDRRAKLLEDVRS
jgi:hypothetical protein